MTAGKIEQLTAVTHDTPQECIDILERKVAALEAENATLRERIFKMAVDIELYADDTLWITETETVIDRLLSIIGCDYENIINAANAKSLERNDR